MKNFILLLITLTLVTFTQSVEDLHSNAWSTVSNYSKYDNSFKYGIYNSRSLMVHNPEIYLKADSIWMEAITTVYGGWMGEYNFRDRDEAEYSSDLFTQINDPLMQNRKYDGTEFKWDSLNWSAHRENSVINKRLYDNDVSYYNYLDLRLPFIWNGLKGINWITTKLTLGEAFYFYKRSNSNNQIYFGITDTENSYVFEFIDNDLVIYDPFTDQQISASNLEGNLYLVMNTKFVWYPLMQRDDTHLDTKLNTIIDELCTYDFVPAISSFEDSIRNDLILGTEIKNELDENWAILFAGRFGKQWGWRAQPIRELCRKLFPQHYKDQYSDNPYELTALNMKITEIGNRLSPAAALLAKLAINNLPNGLGEAFLAVENKYGEWFMREDHSPYVYGEYFKIWLPTFDDKLISKVGDCFVEACNTGAVLEVADQPNWDVWVTNWWRREGGGHVISGVYSGEQGKSFSNGIYSRDGICQYGPLYSLNNTFAYPLVYNTKKGLIASGQSHSFAEFKYPFTENDYLSTIDLVNKIGKYEGDFEFVTGNYNSKEYLTVEDYLKRLGNYKQEWSSFDWNGLPVNISSGLIQGNVTDINQNDLENILVELYSRDNVFYKSVGSDSNGDYLINDIPHGEYKVYFNSTYSDSLFVSQWYDNKLNSENADIIELNDGVIIENINGILTRDLPPSLTFISPKSDTTYSDTLPIIVNASDDYQVSKIEFYFEDEKIKTDYYEPFEYDYDIQDISSGQYAVKAIVYDNQGQMYKDSVTATILSDLPPFVKIINPTSGITLNQDFTIEVIAEDDWGINNVEIYLNSELISILTEAPYSYNCSVSNLITGSNIIKAIATDSSDNQSENQIIIFHSTNSGEWIEYLYSIGDELPDGKFNQAQGIAADSYGNIYVSDRLNQRVQKFNENGGFIKSWSSQGKAYGIDVSVDDFVYVAGSMLAKYDLDGNKIKEWFVTYNGFHDVVTDSEGNVYCSIHHFDGTYCIKKYSSEGDFLLEWGSKGNGQGEFDEPRGLAVDSQDNIYVVDNFNKRVQKFTKDGEYILEWHLNDTVYDGWPRFYGIDVSDSDEIFVCSTDERKVYQFTPIGQMVNEWSCEKIDEDMSNYVQDVIVSNDLVYITDNSNNIRIYNKSGILLNYFGGSSAKVEGNFNDPLGIETDFDGNVYVADYFNSRIQKFDSDGNFVFKWGSYGNEKGNFGLVVDIDIYDNKIYVSDWKTNRTPPWGRIQIFDFNGSFVNSFGTSGINPGEMYRPYGLEIDRTTESIFVINDGNNLLQRFTLTGEFLEHWSISELAEREDYDARGIGIDEAGNVYIAGEIQDQGGLLLKLNNRGELLKTFELDSNPSTGTPRLYDIEFDKFGLLYVADTRNSQIYILNDELLLLEKINLNNSVCGISISNDGELYLSNSLPRNCVDIYQLKHYEDVTTSIDNKNVPIKFTLSQNYPNPFNPTTKIGYSLSKPGKVELKVFDILGRIVTTLVNETQNTGRYEIKFEASHLSSGIYFYQLITNEFIDTKKMIILK